MKEDLTQRAKIMDNKINKALDEYYEIRGKSIDYKQYDEIIIQLIDGMIEKDKLHHEVCKEMMRGYDNTLNHLDDLSDSLISSTRKIRGF